MDSIIARRADAEKLNLENIATLQEQAKKSERDDKYKNLKTLYDNYDAVVKRDYLKMIASLGNLATACDNIAKGTPSGVISDPKTINKAVLFAAAIPVNSRDCWIHTTSARCIDSTSKNSQRCS